MKRSKKALSWLLAVAITFGMSSVSAVQVVKAEANEADDKFASDQILVVFDEGEKTRTIEKVLAKNDAELEDIIKNDETKVALASIEDGESVESAVMDIEQSRHVILAQPNYRYKVTEQDPLLMEDAPSYQRHIAMTKAIAAWDKVVGSSPATVAVLDTGADLGHQDLQETLVSNTNYQHFAYAAESMARDDIDTEEGHGTHVAGIIGATFDNGLGGSGVASGRDNDLVKVLPVGISADGTYMYTYDIVKGIDYAESEGANVINMSFGAEVRDRIMGSRIKEAYADGITLVAAAGNEQSDAPSYPSDMKEVISVTNYTEGSGVTLGVESTMSSYGTAKDIAAPGEMVASTVPGDGYMSYSGTSMASPVVAGACALLIDTNPSLTPEQVRNIICATATSDDKITADEMGYGKLDIEAAVAAANAASANTDVEKVEIKRPADGSDIVIDMEYVDEEFKGDIGQGLDVLVSPATALATVAWSSSDESIAMVDDNGIVTGISPGTCQITATSGGQSDSVNVTIEGGVAPEKVEITKAPQSITIAETAEITVDVSYPEGTEEENKNTELYFSSSDPDIVFVDDEGQIVAKGVGQATVTVKTINGKTAQTDIEVKDAPAKISWRERVDWMRMGTTKVFAADLIMYSGEKDASGGNITWSVSPKQNATIDKETGKVTPKKTGTFWVCAESKASNVNGKTVKKYTKVTIIKNDYKGKGDYNLKKVKAKKNSAKISWKSLPVADKYIIERATKKGKFKVIKKVSGQTKYTDKKLKKKTVYRYRVKAEYVENGARKSFGYSNVLKVKTKKK